MKKTVTTLIAALLVVFLIVALNSFCAGCVYAQNRSAASADSVLVPGMPSGQKTLSTAGHTPH